MMSECVSWTDGLFSVCFARYKRGPLGGATGYQPPPAEAAGGGTPLAPFERKMQAKKKKKEEEELLSPKVHRLSTLCPVSSLRHTMTHSHVLSPASLHAAVSARSSVSPDVLRRARSPAPTAAEEAEKEGEMETRAAARLVGSPSGSSATRADPGSGANRFNRENLIP